MRCLKRYAAREVYRALMSPTATRHAAGIELAARRKRLGLLQRDVAAGLEIRAEVVSSIETERAKHLKARDAYEALLDRIEGGAQPRIDNHRSVFSDVIKRARAWCY